jgi:hypothetical protein
MVDPVTLTAGAIAQLAFQKFIESGAGKLAEKFTEGAIAKMDKLREKIWARLRGRPGGQNALLAAEKGSKADLENVAAHLQLAMVEDPQFADEIRSLAQEIHAGKIQDNSSMHQYNSDNARGWQTKVEGGTAYVGEVHIHQGQPPEAEGK